MTNNLSSNDSVKEIVNEPKNEQCISTLKFLGHDIICSKNSIPQELARICAKDDNLSFDSVNQNVTLYGTTFHLNYRNGVRGFMLMSSVQPDTRQIRIVRDAISKFHGKENFEEDWHYSWLPFTDSIKIGQNYPVIHLRRVHSEDGGTVIIVNYSQDVRNSIMKKVNVFLNVVIGIVIVILLLLFFCNYLVCSNAEGRLYTDVDSVPHSEIGLLLGTTPQTRIGRRSNHFFKYRIDAAEALYKAGKIKSILISGDENSLDGINEVECMRDSLVARGVSGSAIVLDGKGFRTLDAVVRATNVYGQHSYIVISQKFHNERALYLAEHLGLDVVSLYGFNAADATSNMAIMT